MEEDSRSFFIGFDAAPLPSGTAAVSQVSLYAAIAALVDVRAELTFAVLGQIVQRFIKQSLLFA